MPWKCPACETQIRHERETPEPRQVYRCHVCRLELVLDDATLKLAVVPFPTPSRRATDQER
jgi:hypothetical protein